MLFRKKCPACGAKNPKERMTCVECGAPLALEKAEKQVTAVPLETTEGDELTDRSVFVRAAMTKACPECSSQNAFDCVNNPLIEDDTIGHCLDCGIYWCLECGYVFESVEGGIECPHWEICDDCLEEHGYIGQLEFMETICSKCEHYDNGCQLDGPLECGKRWELVCPYEGDVSKCPNIGEETSGAYPKEIGSEYVKYVPGKCAYCNSSRVSETPKRRIKGTVVDGYLWDMSCTDCGLKWVALEKPDFQ